MRSAPTVWVIVPFAPAGDTNLVARLIGQWLSARCADEQGFPSWIRPGDRPPAQSSNNRPLMSNCCRQLKDLAGPSTFRRDRADHHQAGGGSQRLLRCGPNVIRELGGTPQAWFRCGSSRTSQSRFIVSR